MDQRINVCLLIIFNGFNICDYNCLLISKIRFGTKLQEIPNNIQYYHCEKHEVIIEAYIRTALTPKELSNKSTTFTNSF